MKQYSIIHVVKQFYPVIGGLESYVLSLAQNQIMLGHDVTVVTLNRDFKTNEFLGEGEILASGIQIIRVPYVGMKKYPIAPKVLRHVRGKDIVHVHGVDFFIDFLAVTKIFHRRKLVLTTHGGFFHTSWGYHFKRIYFHLITRFTIRAYDVVIGCSENDINVFRRIVKGIVRIDNGVDVSRFLGLKKNPQEGELLYVGRLDIHKRIDHLINIVDHLTNTGFNVHLNIVGPDSHHLEGELKELANSLGISDRISILGAVDENRLMSAYENAWLFLSASEYEGFGISAVEAMASGTICILNDITSFRTFLEGKDFGMICDFKEHAATSQVIGNYLRVSLEEYMILGQKARSFSKQYDWEHVAAAITDLYEIK